MTNEKHCYHGHGDMCEIDCSITAQVCVNTWHDHPQLIQINESIKLYSYNIFQTIQIQFKVLYKLLRMLNYIKRSKLKFRKHSNLKTIAQ